MAVDLSYADDAIRDSFSDLIQANSSISEVESPGIKAYGAKDNSAAIGSTNTSA